jgi:hypothetical protein
MVPTYRGATNLNIGNEVSQNIYSVTIARKPFISSCRASWLGIKAEGRLRHGFSGSGRSRR